MDLNALPSTSQTATTSTSNETHLKHLPSHDVAVFGASCDLSGLNLPTKQDILRCFFFLAERAKLENKMFSYKTFVPHVTDKLIEIWSQLNVEIITKKSVGRKLGTLIDKYQIETKHPKIATFTTFVQSTKELFYIGKCQCDFKAALCSCGLIPDHLKEFMRDQNNVRRLTIPEFVPQVEEPAPTSTIIPTSVEETHLAYEPSTDADEPSSNPQDVPPLIRGPYTPRYDASNYAAMCDRFGVSDRIAAALATSLMQDIDVKDAHGNPIIMDKNKVRRENAKCREELLRKQYDASNLIAFLFDGRKNDALTMEKIDDKLHPRMVKEPHLVVLKEPNSRLIGYTKVENEDAEHKLMTLNGFFVEKEIALDALIGICCDGEPTNTGVRNGILRRFELHLNRPLHWFVCLLHFNELPFRHLFNTLDKSSTTGPRTTPGTLGKQIETCENLPLIDEFEIIVLENMPPDLDPFELSTDSKYLYKMANAISNGVVPADLSHIKPGPIAHSRWLTKANRLLRLYVSTENPSRNLKILATYIMKVYVPMHFNIKYYNSVVFGSVLFHKFIRWTQYLDTNLRQVVNNVIKDNSYYAHSENILLAMLFDDKKETRNIAIKKILHYRRNLYYPAHLRVYQKPFINFNCADYTNMIDLNKDDVLFEPPFTHTIPYDHLEQYIEYDDPPLPDPRIPVHIQATERHVQLLASVSKRVLEKNRHSVMAVTSESREKYPRLESKKDFQK